MLFDCASWGSSGRKMIANASWGSSSRKMIANESTRGSPNGTANDTHMCVPEILFKLQFHSLYLVLVVSVKPLILFYDYFLLRYAFYRRVLVLHTTYCS